MIFNVNTEAPPKKLPVLDASYPQDVTLVASANGSATFKVAIAEDGKPAEYSYQWYVNGTAVAGATGASYTRTGLTAKATYTVYCAVTNKAGTVNSRAATLTVKSYLPEFTYTGSYKLVDEGNYKWKIYFYTSGTLRFTHLGNATGGIDLFLVAGGGGGHTDFNDGSVKLKHGGSGGGYTKTQKAISVSINTNYTITVGGGGAASSRYTAYPGGTSSAFNYAANGGQAGYYTGRAADGDLTAWGGDGGSGGADDGDYVGGYDGGNGNGSRGGKGQGTTTREFGESGGKLYSSGGSTSTTAPTGGGTTPNAPNGAANTGNGGTSEGTSSTGGSGIVVIRNKR